MNEYNEDKFKADINEVLSDLEEMLLEKNRKYGNSALAPLRIFSKASPYEQIQVRIDDKLNRLRSAQLDDREDSVKDLMGYLILYQVSRKYNGQK